MAAGPVNRVLLESHFQDNGQVYSDEETEACLDVLADQIDDNWNYTAGLVANGTFSPYPSFMSRQAIINGNFDVWQRGTSFTNPVSFQYTTDRWKASPNADGGTFPTNVIHSRQILTPGDLFGSYYHYRISPDGAGSSYGVNASYDIRQVIENGTRYLCGLGKKITVSFWARSSIAGKRIGVNVSQTYGTGGSPTAQEILTGSIFNLTSSWQNLTYTFTTNTLVGKTFGSNNDDTISVAFSILWGTNTGAVRFGGSPTAETFGGSGNIDITQVQVNSGDTALPFQPKSFLLELQDCQRYYEKSYDYDLSPASSTHMGSTYWTSRAADQNDTSNITFKVSKRVNPTITLYNPTTGTTGQARNSSTAGTLAITSLNIGKQGFLVIPTANTTAGNVFHYHYTADSEI